MAAMVLQFARPHLTQDPRPAVMATIGSLRLVAQRHVLILMDRFVSFETEDLQAFNHAAFKHREYTLKISQDQGLHWF